MRRKEFVFLADRRLVLRHRPASHFLELTEPLRCGPGHTAGADPAAELHPGAALDLSRAHPLGQSLQGGHFAWELLRPSHSYSGCHFQDFQNVTIYPTRLAHSLEDRRPHVIHQSRNAPEVLLWRRALHRGADPLHCPDGRRRQGNKAGRGAAVDQGHREELARLGGTASARAGSATAVSR